MATAQANVKAVVTGEDKGGTAVIKKFAEAVDRFGEKVDRINTKAGNAGVSIGKMSGAVALGTAAYEAFSRTVGRVSSIFQDSLQAANKYQGALLGLSSVAGAFGHSSQAASDAAKTLAQDGLMTVTDAATGLKSLLATGFSLDEAIKLMERFKDTAAFGRQAALGFGESIRGATEGIKNGNSILTDNAGITKNLSVILREMGKSEQDVMNITSDASVRQALYTGLLRESAAMAGDAAKLSQVYAGAQARAAAQTEIFKQNLGSMLQVVAGPLLNAFTDFIRSNQGAIIAFGLASMAALTLVGALVGLIKVGSVVIGGLMSMTLAAGLLGAALLVIGAIAGVAVFKAVNKMQESVKKSNEQLSKTDKAGELAGRGLTNTSKGAEKLGKELAKIGQQIERANRDFRENLAQMIKQAEDKVKSLRRQLGEEETDFKESQEKMVSDHQERVDEIQKQINQEMQMGRLADQGKIADLQQRLAKENAEFDKQSAKERERHTKRVTDLQVELDNENALLTKHADDVASIRDVMLLDEIDKLKRSHQEQLTAFDQQKQDAIANAKGTTSAVDNIWDNFGAQQNASMQGMGTMFGESMATAFKNALWEGVKDAPKAILEWMASPFEKVAKKGKQSVTDYLSGLKKEVEGLGRPLGLARGGTAKAGSPYIVGEEGPELFMPGQSGTVVPNKQLARTGGSGGTVGGGNNINITIKAQAFSGSQMEARKFAMMLMNAYKDAMTAQGIKV